MQLYKLKVHSPSTVQLLCTVRADSAYQIHWSWLANVFVLCEKFSFLIWKHFMGPRTWCMITRHLCPALCVIAKWIKVVAYLWNRGYKNAKHQSLSMQGLLKQKIELLTHRVGHTCRAVMQQVHEAIECFQRLRILQVKNIERFVQKVKGLLDWMDCKGLIFDYNEAARNVATITESKNVRLLG